MTLDSNGFAHLSSEETLYYAEKDCDKKTANLLNSTKHWKYNHNLPRKGYWIDFFEGKVPPKYLAQNPQFGRALLVLYFCMSVLFCEWMIFWGISLICSSQTIPALQLLVCYPSNKK